MYGRLSDALKSMQQIASRVFVPSLLATVLFLGTGFWGFAPNPALAATPSFEEILIEDALDDGYWVEAFDVNNDGKVDLVTSGLGSATGQVAWYENPGNLTPTSQWTKRQIIEMSKPVALLHQDIDEDGLIDIVITHDYGACMFDCGENDGKISWLKNPGPASAWMDDWAQYPIGDLVASHRLAWGNFTTTSEPQLMVLPIVGYNSDLPPGDPDKWKEPVPVVLYDKPADLYNALAWESQTIDDTYYHVIHGIAVDKFDLGDDGRPELDSLIVASQEGLTWLYYGQDNSWHHDLMALGDLDQPADPAAAGNDNQFFGSGNVAMGKVVGNDAAYIPTLEPFHGNQAAVYGKYDVEVSSPAEVGWKRTMLDIYGYPNSRGEGAGHHLLTADFDGDGNDEFLVAQRGPEPNLGIFYYELLAPGAEQRPTLTFTRTRISSSSAARIALADFDNDGQLDFATTGYCTEGYFCAENPQVLVFLNRIGQ